ncbi:MAG: Mur ligase family protein [Minisyncoccia bacterium]
MHKIITHIKKYIPLTIINFYHLILACFGAIIYNFPSKKMIIIGVTGSRGKTTIANMLWYIFKESGYRPGLVTTANIKINDKEYLNRFHMTMPGRLQLQKLLKQMLVNNCNVAIIETSSEGLEKYRHKFIYYDALILASLYPEYLETHHWSYERLKKKVLYLFKNFYKYHKKIFNKKIIILNNDIESKDQMLFANVKSDIKYTFGLNQNADFYAQDIVIKQNFIQFNTKNTTFKLNLNGKFNISNALASIACAYAFNINNQFIQNGLALIKTIPGRLEEIQQGQNFKVFIDYAHDAVSLENVLKSMQIFKTNNSKIIVVIGAEGGGRDKFKRPAMGQIAAQLSDFIILTNTDPYDDDPYEIMNDILKGAVTKGKILDKDIFLIEDRKKGIEKALKLAKNNDIVIITGKGAEQSMIIKDKVIPWDDRIITKQLLLKMI